MDEEIDWLCHECVGDFYLKGTIKSSRRRHRCKFCNQSRRCLPISDIADLVHVLFAKRCIPSDEERGDTPLFWVAAFLGIEENKVAKAVHGHLSDADNNYQDDVTDYGGDSVYRFELPFAGYFAKKWLDLRQSLSHESRYFNPVAKGILDEIFHGLNFETEAGSTPMTPAYMQDRPVVTEIGPGHTNTVLYRAREARHVPQLRDFLAEPAIHLGPPPQHLARAGRMNPSGVSLFYGALEPETCVAEIRAPVGTYVVTGKFEVLRPLRLLDFEKLRKATEAIPHFHPQYDEKKDRDSFLEVFCFEIATPVHPQDEAFGYLPTQAVAEYLAQRDDLGLDGLLFPSTQTGSKGKNVVLFRSTSVVESLDERFNVNVYEVIAGSQIVFDIITKPMKSAVQPPSEPAPTTAAAEDTFTAYPEDELLEQPKPTLRLLANDTMVSKVTAVEFMQNPARFIPVGKLLPLMGRKSDL